MRTVLIALACLGISVGIAIFGLFVIVFTAGPSIAAGERAAVMAGILDLLLWLGAIVTFWFLNRSVSLSVRILSAIALGVIEFVALGLVFVSSIILLNR